MLPMKNIKWPFAWYGKKKAMLAFEFATVLAEAANHLKIPMTREIVKNAEKLIEKELGRESAEHFACNMNVYTLALLEPKD
jgi:sulfur relay (sulfurtransferase) complex TusBCD TusD component (DsrE family)